jgi:hypothetical protein
MKITSWHYKKTRIKDIGFTLLGVVGLILLCRYFLHVSMVSDLLINEAVFKIPLSAMTVSHTTNINTRLKTNINSNITIVGLLGRNIGVEFDSLLDQVFFFVLLWHFVTQLFYIIPAGNTYCTVRTLPNIIS